MGWSWGRLRVGDPGDKVDQAGVVNIGSKLRSF